VTDFGTAEMAPPKYKDLGKKANDILNEDFKFEQTFELKSQVNGGEIKSIFSDKGKGMTGNMEVCMALCTYLSRIYVCVGV